MESVETPTTRFLVRDDGIIEARGINPETPRTEETVNAAMNALVEIAGGKRKPMLWDVRNLSIGTPGSRVAFVARLSETVSALGLLVDTKIEDSLMSVVEAYSPIVEALLVPVQLFHDEAEAVAWLQGFVGLA